MTDTFIGRSLGKYTVESKLGQGGMGMVYRGRQASLNRSVAIKVLPAQMAMDSDFVQRFRQEAQVIAGLQHENIVHVYDIDRTELASGESIYFIVMEFVDGYNLRQRPDRGRPMAWSRVREIGLTVARALDYAHRRGIVHRDIKPANVMVTTDGKVKLMDFGIAKSAGGVKTATGSVLGTPEYMAPEQVQSGQVTPRSDLYALGVLLYELATGRLPFKAAEPFAVALKHISETPQPPRQVETSVPVWLEAIILQALEKNPADRQGDAATLAHQLDVAGLDTPSSPSALQTERGGAAVLPMDVAPTLETPSGVDPMAPTLQTPASGVPGPQDGTPTRTADLTPPPPPSTGPSTDALRPVAWWPVAAVLGVLALVAVGYFLSRGFLSSGSERDPSDTPAGVGAADARPGEDLATARTLLAVGDLRAARRHLDRHLTQHPDDEAALELQRRLDHAERSLAQAMAADDLLDELGTAPSELPPGAESPETPETQETPETNAKPADDGRPDPPVPPPPSPNTAPKVAPPPPPRPVTPLPQLTLQARRHREAKEFHSLRKVLQQIGQHPHRPGHRNEELEEWRSRVDGWVVDRESDLREEVEDMLDSFLDAVEDEDIDDVEDLWGGRPDGATESTFRNLWQTYRKVRAEYDLLSVEPWDHEAGFTAVVRIYGKKERRDDMSLVRTVRWRGRISDRDGTRMLTPFSP